MNVLIAQKDRDLALDLADKVARAGGRVTGIVGNVDEAGDQMTLSRIPDIILLDPDLSDGQEAPWSQTPHQICLEGNDLSAFEDFRLVLQAVRHFGRNSQPLVN